MKISDRELLNAFEAGTLSPDGFHHREHVQIGWLLLRRDSILLALGRFSVHLRELARNLGKPDLYHETITLAFLLIIQERIHLRGERSFARFEKNNPDLFEWPSPVLERYYSRDLLDSEPARKTFVLPDRLDGHSSRENGRATFDQSVLQLTR